jgi:DNA-binding NtrC family response regulator
VREHLDRLVEELLEKGVPYPDACREFERRFISQALSHTKGNLAHTAKRLGMHRNTLSRKIAEYRLKK